MFEKIPGKLFPVLSFDMLDKKNWDGDSSFTAEKAELFDRLAHIYFNSMKHITPEELRFINTSPTLSTAEKMKMRESIQYGTLYYEYGRLYYWSPITSQVNYNTAYGYIEKVLSPTKFKLKNTTPELLDLIIPGQSKITFQVLKDLEYTFLDCVYKITAVDKANNTIDVEYVEGTLKTPFTEDIRNARVWESGGFLNLVIDNQGYTVIETDIKSLQVMIAQLTRAMKEIDNVDDPSYIKADRWRDYYRTRLAILFYKDNILDRYYDTTGEPLKKWILDEVVPNDKKQSMENLLRLAEEKKKLAESKVKTIDEWIEYLLQSAFYSFSFKLLISFTSGGFGGNMYSTGNATSFNSPFLSLPTSNSQNRDDTDNSFYYSTGYSGTVGRLQTTFNVAKALGLSQDVIKNYELNISSSLYLMREENFLDYVRGANIKYFVNITPTSTYGVYNLLVELYAAQNYHGGTIGATITTVAKKMQ